MRFVLLSVLVLGAGGCAKHGVDAVKDMRARACAGDAAGFFDHVDRGEMLRRTRVVAQAKAEGSLAKRDPAAQAAAREALQERVASIASTLVDDTLTAWANDIKQGPTSDLCRLSILESAEIDDKAEVHVRTPSGGERRWRLARHGDRWSLVEVGD